MSELRYCCIVPDDVGKIVREDRGSCPLKTVAVTGLIRDAVAQYTLVQSYVNPLEDAAVEAVYTFPLYEGVAVCGFEAEVDGRKIVGRVQEKAAARKEYESARNAGKVASLLDEETPDTFQASVGNVPPATTVAIRITLVSEIKQDGDENQVRFVVPTTIAPRYGYGPVDEPMDASATVLSVNMSCAMSKAITSIQSPSHTIEVHLGATDDGFDPNRARVGLTADALLDRDLVIVVQALGLDEPRALVERHPKDGTHAISLTFAPRFALNPIRSLELVFIVDRSGSMTGTPVRKAGAALELFLRSIPCEDHYFNVIGFGSHHEALFPKSVPYNAESLKRGALYAQRMEADMGGTEMRSAFEEAFRLRRRDVPLQIFLLTDGEIWDVGSLCDVIREAVDEGERRNSSVRVFSLGIGDSVSHHLIESVARAGSGYAQLVMESERMEKKVLNMLKSALVPPATDLGVQWTPKATGSDNEVEGFVLVEAEDSSRGEEDAAAPPVVDPNESGSTNETPINLFSTSPEVPSPPPPPPALPPPSVVVPIHQAPFKVPILSRGARFTIYAILSSTLPVPKELVLQGSSPDGPVELKVKAETVREGETMLHSLAARAVVRDLEEGTSCIHALGRDATATQKEMLKRLGVHVVDSEGKKYTTAVLSSKHVKEITKQQILDIAIRYNLSSKYTSWVAIDEDTHRTIVHDTLERRELYGYGADEVLLCVPPAPGITASSCDLDDDDICFALDEVEAVEADCVVDMSCARSSGRSFYLPGADQLEGDQSEEPITGTDPHSRLRSILQHQSFDGSFPLVPEIAAFFSTTVEDLNGTLAEVRKRCVLSTLSESDWETVWATCLAAEFMKKQLPELQDEWELVVDKAEKRVEALLRNVQDVAAIKEAAAAVATAAGSGEQCTEGVVETKEVHVETIAGREISPPLPCLIGIAEPATAAGSGEQKST
jgi:hypothetical protein